MGKTVISLLLAAAFLFAAGLETNAQSDEGDAKTKIEEGIGQLRQAEPSERGLIEDELAKAGKAGAPFLVKALKDDSEAVRCGAAYALGEIGDASAVAPLIELLEAAEAGVRAEAAWALGKIADKRAGDALKQRMQTDADRNVKLCCAFGSAAIAKDAEAFDLINKGLGDEDEKIRSRAAWASGLLGDSRTGEALATAWSKEKNNPTKIAFAFGMVMVPKDDKALDYIILEKTGEDGEAGFHAGRALSRVIRGRIVNLQSGERDGRQKAALDLCKIGGAVAEDEVCERTKPLLKSGEETTREFAVFTFG